MKEQIKVSDLVIQKLRDEGVTTFFGVTGGAVVHFFDSISKLKDTNSVFFNHEQSASFAVEAYAKANQNVGVGIFTTGPGATNALTGLTAAWLDSIPCIFISGQSRSTSTIGQRNLRQVGTQEVKIIDMVKPVTKYAVTVENILDIQYHLDKAIYFAKSGRPGPVWLDVPVDFSWSDVSRKDLRVFDSSKLEIKESSLELPLNISSDLQDLFSNSKRPLVLVGQGCRLSNSEKKLEEFLENSQTPFVTTWNMSDFMEFDHALNIGRVGISGQRGANLAIQNCDLLICLGTHLNNSITGTIFDGFAREAKILVVNVDKDELDNIPVSVDYKINSDVKDFIDILCDLDSCFSEHEFWREKYQKYKSLNDFVDKYSNLTDGVNSMYLKKFISNSSPDNSIFVTDGGGTNVYSSLQSCFNRGDQKLILSTGLCSMGSGIPEAIGAYFACPDRPIFCFVGDGSFPFNVQELQLIKNLQIPLKIFVLNNNGYTSIKTTQEQFLNENFVGSTPESGIHLINVEAISTSFEIDYISIKNTSDLTNRFPVLLESDKPIISEVFLPSNEIIEPRQGFKESDGIFKPQPLEDMFPFLDRKQFDELMIIDSWQNNIDISNREIDLLRNYPKSKRPINDRGKRKLAGDGYIDISEKGTNNDKFFEQLLLKKAKEFGQVYFDGDRLFGYGGYKYDKKYWDGVAKDLIQFYDLKQGDKVLEIGCAKGFLLHDLLQNLPGLELSGIDISSYAIENSIETVRKLVKVGDAKNLPFEDNTFKLVISINTLSELNEDDCRKALREIERVKIQSSFITLNSWDNEESRERFLNWNITAPTNFSKKQWLKIFSEESYSGNYYWFKL